MIDFIFLFIFGSCIGSFINVVIIRLPKEMNLSTKRSACPHCEKKIVWYENIPVLSYLILRGKCSKCSQKISLIYPLVEIIFGVVAYLLAPTSRIAPLSMLMNLDRLMWFFLHLSVFSSFFALFVIDLKHKLLPDKINFYLALNLLMMALLRFSLAHILLGALIGFIFTYGVTWIFYKLRGEIGLGGGDIKLFSALGLYLGPIGIIHNIFLSCMTGAICSLLLMSLRKIDRKTPVPFGPFIIVVAFVQIFFPDFFTQVISVFVF